MYSLPGARHDRLAENSPEARVAWQARQDALLDELSIRGIPAEVGSRGVARMPLKLRQFGMCMGFETPDPMETSAQLPAAGMLAAPSLDDAVLLFRPVLTLSDAEADAIVVAARKALG